MNLLLAEYPTVAVALKTAAKQRADAAEEHKRRFNKLKSEIVGAKNRMEVSDATSKVETLNGQEVNRTHQR